MEKKLIVHYYKTKVKEHIASYIQALKKDKMHTTYALFLKQ